MTMLPKEVYVKALRLFALMGIVTSSGVLAAQVDVTTTATAVAASGTNRSALTVKNHNDSTACVYCQPGTATTTSGIEICAGQAFTWDDCQHGCQASQAFTCISASGTQRVSVDKAE